MLLMLDRLCHQALVFALFAPRLTKVYGELIAGAVIPHGDFAFDPTLLPDHSAERRAAEDVSKAARVAGSWLANDIQPDMLLLSTPHGMELTNEFAFYLGSSATGYVDIGSDLHNNQTKTRFYLNKTLLAPNETRSLLEYLRNQSVSGILNYADSEDMGLRWGEVIPLLLIGRNETRRHMLLSHPLRRYTESPSMVPELLQLGRSIKRWADGRPERIALVISSDLSHTHRADGPYGYSNASTKFDAAVGRWAKNPIEDSDALLVEATSLQEDAKSCGFTGLVTLHGALGDSFDSDMLANSNATYYGMMVAIFYNKKAKRQTLIRHEEWSVQ